MIDEKKFAAELQQWRNRLGESYDEEVADIILKAVVDRLKIQPKVCASDKCSCNKKWIPVRKQLPSARKNITVWASFNGQTGPYTRKCIWCCGRFTWPNGKEIPVMPVAWKPYYVPEPYGGVIHE